MVGFPCLNNKPGVPPIPRYVTTLAYLICNFLAAALHGALFVPLLSSWPLAISLFRGGVLYAHLL